VAKRSNPRIIVSDIFFESWGFLLAVAVDEGRDCDEGRANAKALFGESLIRSVLLWC
jgi:hypothetical protein